MTVYKLPSVLFFDILLIRLTANYMLTNNINAILIVECHEEYAVAKLCRSVSQL